MGVVHRDTNLYSCRHCTSFDLDKEAINKVSQRKLNRMLKSLTSLVTRVRCDVREIQRKENLGECFSWQCE